MIYNEVIMCRTVAIVGEEINGGSVKRKEKFVNSFEVTWRLHLIMGDITSFFVHILT